MSQFSGYFSMVCLDFENWLMVFLSQFVKLLKKQLENWLNWLTPKGGASLLRKLPQGANPLAQKCAEGGLV